MTRRVVVTGLGTVTALGESWEENRAGLLARKNAVAQMPEWDIFSGLNTKLAAPIKNFTLPEHYTRKRIRSMGRVSLLSTRATEYAIESAGLLEDEFLKSGRVGIAYGSCTGSTAAVCDFADMLDLPQTVMLLTLRSPTASRSNAVLKMHCVWQSSPRQISATLARTVLQRAAVT